MLGMAGTPCPPETDVSGGLKLFQSDAANKELAGAASTGILADACCERRKVFFVNGRSVNRQLVTLFSARLPFRKCCSGVSGSRVRGEVHFLQESLKSR